MKLYLAVGGLDKVRFDLFNNNGVKHVLISFADVKGKEHIKLPFDDCIMDSGAYSIATNHAKVALKAYTLWLELYLDKYPQIKTYVNLDDLDDPRKSMDNLSYMEAHSLSPMPVYHYREPPEILDQLCEKYEYVGLGGLAVGIMPTSNLKTFWEWCYERYPDNRFHIFGASAMGAFTKYQPYSLDSTSWCVGTKFGRLAGYKEGKPAWFELPQMKDGAKLFFTSYELWAECIRAMVDWEKLKWLENIDKVEEFDQRRLI